MLGGTLGPISPLWVYFCSLIFVQQVLNTILFKHRLWAWVAVFSHVMHITWTWGKEKTYLDYKQVKKGKKDKRKKEILVHLHSPFRGSLLDAQYMISLHMFPYFQVGLEGEYLGLDKISLANSSLWTRDCSSS